MDPTLMELTGLPSDPDCLHCAIAPLLEQFSREHPHKASRQTEGELIQAVAEFIASGIVNARVERYDDHVEALVRLLKMEIDLAVISFRSHGLPHVQ